MHIYFYDTSLNQKKYDSLLARIETRITDLGLNGKIIRLGLTNSISDSVRSEVKKGAKTITVVGNDDLVNAGINAIARMTAMNMVEKPIPLGIIPVGNKNNHIADHLGIETEEGACDILSARRVETLDLGLANKTYFLAHAVIDSGGTSIEIDGNYTIDIAGAGTIGVVNLPVGLEVLSGIDSRADDGTLELFIKTSGAKKFHPLSHRRDKQSVFSFKKLKITNKTQPVMIDGVIAMRAPVEVGIAKEKIQLIVGKKRRF